MKTIGIGLLVCSALLLFLAGNALAHQNPVLIPALVVAACFAVAGVLVLRERSSK